MAEKATDPKEALKAAERFADECAKKCDELATEAQAAYASIRGGNNSTAMWGKYAQALTRLAVVKVSQDSAVEAAAKAKEAAKDAPR